VTAAVQLPVTAAVQLPGAAAVQLTLTAAVQIIPYMALLKTWTSKEQKRLFPRGVAFVGDFTLIRHG
jgi:hypothetical protein